MNDIRKAKQAARKKAQVARDALSDRDSLTQSIIDRLFELPKLRDANSVCCFVSFRSEVSTHTLISRLLDSGKEVCVPWCKGNDLQLYKLETLEELETGSFGILEPTRAGKDSPKKRASVVETQTVIVPGLAFTRDGKRLGYGRGYYDRLLAQAPNVHKIALAFECQIVDELPVTPDDIRMDYVLTELNAYARSELPPPVSSGQNVHQG